MKPGPNIFLTPYEPKDWDLLYRWYYSGDYPEFFRDIDRLPDSEYFQQYARLRNGFTFLIRATRSFKAVGAVVVYEWKAVTQQAHFAMLVDKGNQGEMMGLETIWLTMKHLFQDLGLRKMVIEILADNKDFVRYMEMYQVPVEATLRDEAKLEGEFKNVLRFTIFRDHAKEIIKRIGEIYGDQSSNTGSSSGSRERYSGGERSCGTGEHDPRYGQETEAAGHL